MERAAVRLTSFRSGVAVADEPAERVEGDEQGLEVVDAMVASADPRFALLCCARASGADATPLHEALAAHVGRRARAAGRACYVVRAHATDDAWCELAVRLGVATNGDPSSVVRALIDAAGSALVVVCGASTSSFGRAIEVALAARLASMAGPESVATMGGPRAPQTPQLVAMGGPESPPKPPESVGWTGDAAWSVSLGERAGSGPLFVVLTERASLEIPLATRILLREPSTRAELSSFWQALTLDAGERLLPALGGVEALERWWRAAQATPLEARADAPALSPHAARLLRRLELAGRPWPTAEVGRLAPLSALSELASSGLVELGARGVVVLVGGASSSAPSAEDVVAVAEALESASAASPDDPDPWAFARASELHALNGDATRAEAAAVRALTSAADPSVRADLWSRWQRTQASLPAEGAAARLARAAELGLRVGDVDRALDLAREAVAVSAESHQALLTLGRATAARGDLTTAAIALGKAMECSPDAGARARVAVEMAEVRYLAGDMPEARRLADLGLTGLADRATRLAARNVHGKLLLAASEWDEAEQHFAVDACDAACAGDVPGELRARVNRAIALLSSARRDEAREMLAAVLVDGERHGELRAISFALANLAAIATLRHDYGEALRLSERSIDVRRRIGERLGLARVIVNLADLRVRVGLVDEAEQALGFGRLACGPGMPAARAVHFALVAARVHLARGRSLEASVEIGAALAGAAHSSDGALRGECHRVAVKIALEDGDVVRAAIHLEKARPETGAARLAELAVLEAALLRARGEPFDDAAREALALARDTDDLEAGMEGHVLAHLAAALAGDAVRAAVHLEAALAVRERLARSLPETLRRRFLARRDLAELARLERSAAESAPSTVRSMAAARPATALLDRASLRGLSPAGGRSSSVVPALERMVGRSPALRSLATAIRKVAQTDAVVLVHGESGTGKELVADALHELGARHAGPLVKVNCAALVETLLLSELFGHEKGSFTGAATRRRGRFEAAEGGTLFLDEIGDISARTQVALLRVLQERTYERVGGTTSLRADVRVVCATHRDLPGMVARGEFREDLYYRLSGVVLEVPALRQRLEDLSDVASALLARVAAERNEAPKCLSPAALAGLAAHTWPGNVRELDNALRAATVFAEGSVIEYEDLAANVEAFRSLRAAGHAAGVVNGMEHACDAAMPLASPSAPSLDARSSAPPSGSPSPVEVAYTHIRAGVSLGEMKRLIEQECIGRALAESGGNITRAAALLGMKRPRLSQLVKQYGLGGGSDDGGAGSDSSVDGAAPAGASEDDGEHAGCSSGRAISGDLR